MIAWAAPRLEAPELLDPMRPILSSGCIGRAQNALLNSQLKLDWKLGDVDVGSLAEAVAESERVDDRKAFRERLETRAQLIRPHWHSPATFVLTRLVQP